MSKRNKKLLSIVSIILCITILSSIPVQALSDTIDKSKKDTVFSSFNNIEGETEEIGNIIAEDTSARTEYTKEFLLDDGTTMFAQYNQPIHYKNDKNKWVDYDNSLVAENITATDDEAISSGYSNKNSNIKIKLSNKAKSNNMISLRSEDYSISWGYSNPNKSKAVIRSNKEKLVGNEIFTTLKNLTSETVYKDVYKDVDLQYFVSSTGIKENIILKSSAAQNEFNITYKINNLTAKQTDNYNIVLFNKRGEEVYTISAPYMYDAGGELSTQLKLEIVSQKGANLNVKLTADYWFIHGFGRSFPITIDPEISTRLTSAQMSINETSGQAILSYGPYYLTENNSIILRANSLPALGDGDKLVSAKYNFETTNGSTLFESSLVGEYRQTDGGDLSYFLSCDSDGNKVEKTSINGQTKTITTGTDEDGKSYVSNDGVTAKTTTDDFGRTTEVKTIRDNGNSVFLSDYEYANGNTANSTTNLVSKLTQKYGANELVNYEYTYDGNGNITQIYENGTLAHKYTYDSLNQLYSEYDYINNFYISYSYDSGGNLYAKHEQYLDSYGYPSGSPIGNVYYYNDTEWKDKLTGINGYNITYDASGNPLSYRDGITFTWQNGRQLSSLQTADNSVSYKYDSNGMRTQKTDNGDTTYYYYDSNKNLIALTKGNYTLLFYYDSDGNVTSFKYNGTMYYYIKNLQGDVVKIINQSGTECVSYVYDAWGNIKSVSGNPILRELNPFRYRSYVYDEETSLYYLQSRYYDPLSGRFLNADVYCDTQTGSPLSTNMFAYCENNSVAFTDIDGYAYSKAGKSTTKRYDRNKVLNYAKKYYKVNGFWRFSSGYNPNYYYYPSGDCTNFVSQCLFAGGIPQDSKWFHRKSTYTDWHGNYASIKPNYSISEAWRICNSNYKYFKKSTYAKNVYTINDTKKSVQSNAAKLKVGDPLYMDEDGDGKPNHAVIISKIDKRRGKIYYAAHTNSCFDKDLEFYLTHNSISKKKVYAIALKDNF